MNSTVATEAVDPLWPTFEVAPDPVTEPAFVSLGLTTMISAQGLNPRAAVATPAAASLFTAYGDLIEALLQAQAALPCRESFAPPSNLTEAVVAAVADALNASEIVVYIHDLLRDGASKDKIKKEFESWVVVPSILISIVGDQAINRGILPDGFHTEVFAFGHCGEPLAMAVTSTHYAAMLVHAKTVADALLAARTILPTAWVGKEKPCDVIEFVDAVLEKVRLALRDYRTIEVTLLTSDTDPSPGL